MSSGMWRLNSLMLWLLLLICGCPSKTRRTWEASDHSEPIAQGNPPSAEEASEAPRKNDSAVRVLWIAQCSRCHGESGAGDGPGRLPMMQMPNMQDAKWQASKSDEAIVASITQGKGMMPAFGKALRPEAISALTEYIRSMRTNN